jgi:putative addiction module killer protein
MEIRQTANYEKWYHKQSDHRLLSRIASRLNRIAGGLMGDVKSVGDGVSEIRIDYAQGYRIYFTKQGKEVVLLLCAGDKSSQSRDIEAAKTLAKQQ